MLFRSPSEANAWSGQNVPGIADSELDGLIDRLEVALDPGERRTLIGDLQKRFMALLPSLPLYWRADPFVIPKWLHGVEPTGSLDPSTLWVERWRAE